MTEDVLLDIILLLCFVGAMAIIIFVYMVAGYYHERRSIQISRRFGAPYLSNGPHTDYTHVCYGEAEDARDWKRENIY